MLLDTRPTGTRAGNLMRLAGSVFEVHLRPSSRIELEKVLADNQPPLVFLKAGFLDYWSMDIFHAAVLAGVDSQSVALIDPFFATGPQTTSLQSFEKAWAQTGQFTALLLPRQKA